MPKKLGFMNYIWKGRAYSTEITLGDGKTGAPGDYVVLVDAHHRLNGYGQPIPLINSGRRRRIQNIVDGRLELFINSKHPNEPYRTTLVLPSSVRHAGHQSSQFIPYHRPEMEPPKGTPMLYIAVKLPNGIGPVNYQSLTDNINTLHRQGHVLDIMAETTESVLKEKIRQDIACNPDNRWLMLHGNILARAEHPPVRFSQW